MSDPGRAISILADKFYRLRDGLRILRSFAAADPGFPTGEQLREIGGRIQQLARQLREPGDDDQPAWMSDFAEIDGELDTFGDGLRGLLVRFSPDQLAALATSVSDRDKLTSLLDLCLDHPKRIHEYVEPVTFLIRHLATEVHGGRLVLVADPPYVTDRLGELTDRFIGVTSENVCTWLSQNWSQLPDDRNADDVRKRMRECRRRTRKHLVVPDALRALIELMIAGENRILELSDESPGGEEDPPPYRDPSDEPTPSLHEVLPSLASAAEESPAVETPAIAPASLPADGAMELLRQALCARIQRREPDPGPAAEAAALIELTRFNAFDRASLMATTNDPIPLAVRRAVLIGAVLRHREQLGSLAPALGLDLDEIETAGANEARDELRGHVNAEIAHGNYQESKALGAVLNRHLPVGTGRRAEPKAKPRQARPSDRSFQVEVGDTFKPSTETPEPSGGDRRQSRRWQSKAEPAPRKRKRRWKRVLITAVVALGVLGPAQFVLWQMMGGLRGMSGSDLRSISPHLESAERSRGGRGPIMTGILSSSWLELDDWERRSHADDIQLGLRRLDIESATLFDRRRQLQVQYAAGRITFVRTRNDH